MKSFFHRALWVTLVVLAIAARDGQAQGGGPTVAFQPGFHQVLRSYIWRNDITTFRIKIPIGRSGNRVRVSFKAGEADGRIHAANIALAGARGELASDPAPLTFNGSPEARIAPWQRITSDSVNFTVLFGAEVYVSFEADWAIAASTINAFPDSYIWLGSYSTQRSPPAGTPWMRAVVNTIDVEGRSDRALVAIGDSITEGYVSGDVGDYISSHDDYRDAWPAVAQSILRVPFANAGASGQGIDDTLAQLSGDVLALQGITDCVVLIGTNDLHALAPPLLESKLTALFDRLRPFCRVWAGTFPPISRPSDDHATIVSRRMEVNDWIRHRAAVADVIDFESVLAAPGDVNSFREGLDSGDGIHPSVQGQHAMGVEAARVLAPPTLQSLSPDSGSTGGGTIITVTATGLKPGATALVGGAAALDVVISAPTSMHITAPVHEAGSVDVSIKNPDGQSATLVAAFRYQDPNPPPDPPLAPSAKQGCNATQFALVDPVIFAAILLTIFCRFGSQSFTWRRRRRSYPL